MTFIPQVELAKYEEQERKQEKHLSEAQKSEDQSIEETSQLICDKVEPTVELEEKLKVRNEHFSFVGTFFF